MKDLRQERDMWKIKLPLPLEEEGTENIRVREIVRWYSEEDLGRSLSEDPNARWFGPATS